MKRLKRFNYKIYSTKRWMTQKFVNQKNDQIVRSQSSYRGFCIFTTNHIRLILNTHTWFFMFKLCVSTFRAAIVVFAETNGCLESKILKCEKIKECFNETVAIKHLIGRKWPKTVKHVKH